MSRTNQSGNQETKQTMSDENVKQLNFLMNLL